MARLKLSIINAIGVAIVFLLWAEGWAGDWKAYWETVEGGVFYFDPDRVAYSSRSTIQVWLKGVYSEKERAIYVKEFGKRYENLSHALILSEMDCFAKKIRSLSETAYALDGKVLYSSQKPQDWEIIVPGTNAEGLYIKLCR